MLSVLIRSFRVGLLPFLCAAPAFAQNAATSVSVDANASRNPISPNIYGFAFGATSDLAAMNFTMNRSGGNLTSTYNWQLNAANHDNDYYFESILDSPGTPGYDGDNFITLTRAAGVGAQPLLTIPMIGYLAKLGSGGAMLWSYSIAKYGAQTGSDPYQPDAGNGISAATGKPITTNNPLDANTPNSVSIQQAWLEHLISTWGTSASGGLKYYLMDNEPSLWSSTHQDIHPAGETYDELYNDYVTYAGAVRALDPSAIIVGPEEWSWWAMFVSGHDQENGTGGGSDYSNHGQTYYYPWLLQQLYSYQGSSGNQLLNVLSVHYYPQELSDSDDDSPSGQLTRNQSTRVLWDPAYVDPSWFNEVGINGGIVNLIPTLKGFVSQYYPGLQTAITEYNWGDEANLNGATTQADVLGIFGREGLDIATRWTVPANSSPTYLAMEIYRNYDGNRSTFGDTSVAATVANPDYLSSFAAVRSSDGALTVMVINKQQGSTPVTISLANFATTGTAEAWQIASATQTSITQLGSVTVTNNTITATVPSQSITLFVIPAGSVTSAPAAPTGLRATVGSGTVTLTWNQSGGATSYTVKRSAVSGGPYAALGSVPDTAPTYTDTGLANGTAYYYVVSAANAAGTSPNSAELAVTPIVPPTFSSSASASPNPVVQGAATTIQATVTCASGSLTNGNVQVLVLDSGGNTAATENYSGQNFTALQSHQYSFALTPAIAGTYTVEVGVFSATWQQWNWNSSAANITVNSSVVFTSSATAPSTLAPGGTASISVTVTETGAGGLSNGNVELQIFNSSGIAVATQVWSGQNFTSGQSLPYSYNWTTAGTLALGNYSVDLGVFDTGWTHDYYWNTDATITVTAAQPPAALSIAKSHSGNFTQGQTNVTYLVKVSNAVGAGPTYGTVTVTETAPVGLTLVSMAGTGWTCSGTACTRSDALAAGGNYPAITVTVNVANDAASPQVNSVSATGGGSATANSSDSTVIAPLLVPVTIQTSPTTLQFSVDGGSAQTAPQSVNLSQGVHTIAVVTTQLGPAGTQYVLAHWSDGTVGATDSIAVGGSPATYTAAFQTQYQLTIGSSPAVGGSVTPASGTFYNVGAAAPIAATTNTGYTFNIWSGAVASANSTSTTVTMNAPETVTANFSSQTGITIQTNPTGLQFSVDSGTPQAAPQTLNLTQGAHTIAVMATQAGPAGAQFVFNQWSDSGAASHSIAVGGAPATYIATFKTQYQLTIAALPVAAGSVTPVSGTFYDATTLVLIGATVNAGYTFSGWSGPVASATSASTTVTMSAPETVTANFSSPAGITVQTNPPGLQFSLDSSVYTAPQTLSLSQGAHTIAVVTRQAGPTGTQYVFTQWSDGFAASHSITVGGTAATYTASFGAQYLLTTAVTPASAGSVTASPSSSGYYNAGTSVQLTASANSGYQFTNWTGDLSGATNPQSIAMNAPHSVTANFAIGTTSCTFGLTPSSANLPPTGTSTVEVCPNSSGQPNCGVAPEVPRTFTIIPSASCGAWTATSSNPGDLQIVSGASGSGSGSVGFTAVNNTHNGQQSYTITVASGAASAAYSVTEAGSGDSQVYREVYALYEQLLGRDPDPAGFGFWTGAGGAGLGQMADSFLTSPEAFNSDFAVMAAYQAAAGVPPTFAQFRAAVASIPAGTQTIGGLFGSLIGSGYSANNLYLNLLNRLPAGPDSTCLGTGLGTCFQTIIGFPASTTPVGANSNNEFQSTGSFHTTLAADHTNGLYMQMIYYVTVSRDPDPAGLAFWTGIANSGGPGVLFQGSVGYSTRIQILGPGTPNQGFIGSLEFQGLFAN